MRQITTHQTNNCNNGIAIFAANETTLGGAPVSYCTYFGSQQNKLLLPFQNGSIQEAGINGFTIEAILAIAVDRLQCFQEGDYKCRENALAITKLEEAMHWLQHRTNARVKRGVEGTRRI